MAAALLAAYPDLFAASASVAGLPVGAARSGMQATLRMASAGPEQSPEPWANQVRAAAPDGFDGPWPWSSVWQGPADMTVAPENATLLATQWRALHDLDAGSVVEKVRNSVQHQTRPDGKRRQVELWSLLHLPHAYPAGTRLVAPGRFVEQRPIDAIPEIARFFGLD
jgi:poly(3-hydroxybutyrate) depolymerase